MNDEKLDNHLRMAIVAAKRAGQMILEHDGKHDFSVEAKHANDYVTDVDKASETMIIDFLRDNFPFDCFFGEECGRTARGEGRWVIDPIDGTLNFSRGIPDYTISIAWEVEPHNPLVGVVYNPRQDELFAARRGGGAMVNGRSIHVSSVSEPRRSIIVCVPPFRRHGEKESYYEVERRFFDQASEIRSFGSCALELCYIAAGRVDGYYENGLGYYDIAAGAVILAEAGGILENPGGTSDYHCDILASNGLLQPWMRTVTAREDSRH